MTILPQASVVIKIARQCQGRMRFNATTGIQPSTEKNSCQIYQGMYIIVYTENITLFVRSTPMGNNT